MKGKHGLVPYTGVMPIDMMLIAKHFDEATIYRAAYSFEQAKDWEKM